MIILQSNLVIFPKVFSFLNTHLLRDLQVLDHLINTATFHTPQVGTEKYFFRKWLILYFPSKVTDCLFNYCYLVEQIVAKVIWDACYYLDWTQRKVSIFLIGFRYYTYAIGIPKEL